MKRVTLLSDFGQGDPYVAAMKGVVLSHTPDAQLIDLSHDVPPHDILAGRLFLEAAVPYYPAGTIHLAVVDPGVGTDRRALIVGWKNQFLVGPDNGLFGFAAGTGETKYWSIDSSTNEAKMSPTFHGRDLFAPAAGKLAAGMRPDDLGDAVESIVSFSIPEPIEESGEIRGEVLIVDRFGNLITNIEKPRVKPNSVVYIGEKEIGTIRRTYGDGSKGETLALWDSRGRLEIAVREGSAAEMFGATRGTRVIVRN